MTKEHAIWLLQHRADESGGEIHEAYVMAIKAISQINDIKAIINNPMYIQEDVLRYQMICEVIRE